MWAPHVAAEATFEWAVALFDVNGVKIILRLTWVTFAVGARWSALGVGVGLGEGREGRGRPSAMRRGRER